MGTIPHLDSSFRIASQVRGNGLDQIITINTNKGEPFSTKFMDYYNAPAGTITKYGDIKIKNRMINIYKATDYIYDTKNIEEDVIFNKIHPSQCCFTLYYNRGTIINKNGIIIEILTQQYTGEFKDTFNKILSTLTFESGTRKLPTPTSLFQKIDIANWKSYSNSEDGYSIKYPLNWSVHEQKQSLHLTKINCDVNIDRKACAFTDIIGIQVGNIANNGTLEDILNSTYNKDKNLMFQNFMLDGLPARRATILGLIDGDYVFIKKNGKFFSIYLEKVANKRSGLSLEIFNQILSTFKFTK